MSDGPAGRFPHPVLGQEAIVPKYGLGRVISFEDEFPKQTITVKTYADGIQRTYAFNNVELIPFPRAKLGWEWWRKDPQ